MYILYQEYVHKRRECATTYPSWYIIFLKGCINEWRVGMATILKFLCNGDGFIAKQCGTKWRHFCWWHKSTYTAEIERDVQCRRIMSLVAISVRVTLTIPGQPRIVSHAYSSTPCQSIPDRQSYFDSPRSTTDRCSCWCSCCQQEHTANSANLTKE